MITAEGMVRVAAEGLLARAGYARPPWGSPTTRKFNASQGNRRTRRQRGAIDTITPTTIARLVERQDRQTPRATHSLGRWIADGGAT